MFTIEANNGSKLIQVMCSVDFPDITAEEQRTMQLGPMPLLAKIRLGVEMSSWIQAQKDFDETQIVNVTVIGDWRKWQTREDAGFLIGVKPEQADYAARLALARSLKEIGKKYQIPEIHLDRPFPLPEWTGEERVQWKTGLVRESGLPYMGSGMVGDKGKGVDFKPLPNIFGKPKLLVNIYHLPVRFPSGDLLDVLCQVHFPDLPQWKSSAMKDMPLPRWASRRLQEALQQKMDKDGYLIGHATVTGDPFNPMQKEDVLYLVGVRPTDQDYQLKRAQAFVNAQLERIEKIHKESKCLRMIIDAAFGDRLDQHLDHM